MTSPALPSSIHNPSVGAVIPSTWGDQVNSVTDYVMGGKPHCRVYNSSNISIGTSGTAQILTFNSERYDVGAMHSTVSNTSRITFPDAGVYAGGCNIRYAASGTGYRFTEVLLNGTTVIAAERRPVTAEFAPIPVPFEYAFAANDYIEVRVTQNSGGALNAEAAGNYAPEFWAHWKST